MPYENKICMDAHLPKQILGDPREKGILPKGQYERKRAFIMRINNNVTALNSHRQYNINNGNIAKNVERLSSGFRVNRAADDAAGLAISEKMRAQIRGLAMGSKNAQDAISLVQTAEGALQSTHGILQRMRELAVQSASDTNETCIDRAALDLEFQQLIYEIEQTANLTEFNQQKLINGRWLPDHENNIGGTDVLTIQAGANAESSNQMTITIGALSSTGLGLATMSGDTLVSNFNVRTDASTSRAALQAINDAINSVSMQRAWLGAVQNRLEFRIQNLDISAENLQAAESRIRDVDMAKQMTTFTRDNILFQASTAMLAQANALPQGVLQLLG